MAGLQQSNVLLFKSRSWIAYLNETWLQGKGGGVMAITVELKRVSNASKN